MWCSPETTIATLDECSVAKTALDLNAAAVTTEHYEGAPKGCSLYKGLWIFNTHATGKLDGFSEPVCVNTAGEPSYVRAQEIEHTLNSFL